MCTAFVDEYKEWLTWDAGNIKLKWLKLLEKRPWSAVRHQVYKDRHRARKVGKKEIVDICTAFLDEYTLRKIRRQSA